MIAPRFLVPIDAKTADLATPQEKSKDGRRLGTSTIVSESKQAGFVPPKGLFAEAMLENSPTRPPRRVGDFVVSATVQVLFLAVLLLVPLYFSEAIDVHHSSRSVAPKPRVLSVSGKLVAPRVIPRQIARLSEEPDGNDLAAAIAPGEGVAGGVPGGVPGGVIGGVLSGAAPPAPAPISVAPKGPIRAGGKVKAPRLISAPDPVYPVLARQARIGGAVVIDAVIDTQGNVIEMQTVSGQPLLALAAMEALRHWKYEPTTLGGEVVPVRLLVTIAFDWKSHRE